jgi:small conductance mechanosensitive channel
MIEQIKDFVITKAPDYFFALAFLIVGWIIINIVVTLFKNTLSKRKVDPTLLPFICSLLNALLKVALIISVAAKVGIQTTSFVAVLGAAGLAVGLALQGSLANFAGGVLILIFKPLKVGDYIEACGHGGTVKEIQIFLTILTTTDNKTIVLPNGSLANGPIVNYSTQTTRRMDIVFGISYDDDFKKAKEIIKNLLDQDERVLKTPEYFVRVTELADSSVNIQVRAWVNSADLWNVRFDLIENTKTEFDSQGISFPFPQRDVTLYASEGMEKFIKQ